MWQSLLFVFVASFAAHTVFVLGSLGASRLARVPVKLVSLGVGPALITTPGFVLRLLPLSAFVRMRDTRDGDSPDTGNTYDRQPRAARVLIMLAGPLALLLTAVAMRGADGWRSFKHAFDQIFMGAFSPHDLGPRLVNGLLDLNEQQGWWVAVAAVLAKVAAFNCLPFPTCGGGAALVELLRPADIPGVKSHILLQKLSLFFLLPLLLSWLVAIGIASYGRYAGG